MTSLDVAQFFRDHDNYLVLTHKRPDGDTVGCAAALCRALRTLGKTAWVLENPDATRFFTPYLEGLIAPAEYTPACIVTVDVATLDLLHDNAAVYKDRVALAIDHHPSNTGFAHFNFVDPHKAACGEVLYPILRELTPITPDIALPLYVAVSTDTGCFVYSNTSANSHRVAADLLDTGFDSSTVNKFHFRTKSLKRLRIESELINGMHLYEGDTVAVATIPLSMLARLNADNNDLEDIAALLGQIEGVLHSITIRELAPGQCKLSVRTDPTLLNASHICAKLGGGGHAAAAGCTVQMGVEEAEAAILDALKQVKYA